MNEDHRSTGKTLPFARPARAPGRGGKGAPFAVEIGEELLDIVRQEPEMNISKTVLLGKQVGEGRYRVDASRVASRLLDFEGRLQRDQDSGGRSASSKGRSSASSTSHDDSSN